MSKPDTLIQGRLHKISSRILSRSADPYVCNPREFFTGILLVIKSTYVVYDREKLHYV